MDDNEAPAESQEPTKDSGAAKLAQDPPPAAPLSAEGQIKESDYYKELLKYQDEIIKNGSKDPDNDLVLKKNQALEFLVDQEEKYLQEVDMNKTNYEPDLQKLEEQILVKLKDFGLENKRMAKIMAS